MNKGIETALDVFNFEPVPSEKIDEEFRCQPKILYQDKSGNCLEELIGSEQTSCFVVKRASVVEKYSRQEEMFFYGIVTEGSGILRTENETLTLKQWDRFFLPAAFDNFQYISDTGMTVLECCPGNS